MRRALPFLAVLTLCAGAPREAGAYTCDATDPRTDLPAAGAAFVGFVEAQIPNESYWARTVRFRVERVVKGVLPETVDVTFPYGSAEYRPGARFGLTMTAKDGAWRSSDCERHDPDELVDAATPLRRPPGRGRAAYVVAGRFGDASLALLDRSGRTLAYGGAPVDGRYGSAFPLGAVACPGGRRIVQLTPGRVIVRRTRDLRPIRTTKRGETRRVHCLGDTIVRARPEGLFRGGRPLWVGSWIAIAFHGRFAYVLRGPELFRVDLRTGRERRTATVGTVYPALSVSPDGRRLAAVSFDHRDPPEQSRYTALVVDLGDGSVRSRDLGTPFAGVAPVWLTDSIVAHGTASAFYGGADSPPPRTLLWDVRLDTIGEIAGWSAWPAVGSRGALVGLVGHRLQRGSRKGTAELGRLATSDVDSLEPLPEVPIRASRRVPRF